MAEIVSIISLLHLKENCFVLRGGQQSSFAFLCERLTGVRPNRAFRHEGLSISRLSGFITANSKINEQ
jgi:hypothetical protein